MKGDVEKSAGWRQMLYGFEKKSWGIFVTCFREVKATRHRGRINYVLANQEPQK